MLSEVEIAMADKMNAVANWRELLASRRKEEPYAFYVEVDKDGNIMLHARVGDSALWHNVSTAHLTDGGKEEIDMVLFTFMRRVMAAVKKGVDW